MAIAEYALLGIAAWYVFFAMCLARWDWWRRPHHNGSSSGTPDSPPQRQLRGGA